MSEVNVELRDQLRILRLELTRKDYKALVAKLADQVLKWRHEEPNPHGPPRAGILRVFDKILMDAANTRIPSKTPLPTDNDGIRARVGKILTPLLSLPVLALAVRDALNKQYFAGPWGEIRAGVYARANACDSGLPSFGYIQMTDKDVLMDGTVREHWKTTIRLPETSEPGTVMKHSYEDAKATVDLALQSDGVLLLDRMPITMPHGRSSM